MILVTTTFQEAANTILFAAGLDKENASNVELKTKDNRLILNVTNKEYYVAVGFEIESTEPFRATVEASKFLNLISKITTETFELKTVGSSLVVKTGKSSYKLPMIYDNDELLSLAPITLDNVTVSMNISSDILSSIVRVNSKELLKAKNLEVTELQKHYYITEDGCFTFTTGACMNKFTLDKPIQLLLNDKIVKLFKLFKTDAAFSFGYDPEGYTPTAKVVFENSDVYVAAKVCHDDVLLSKVQGPYSTTQRLIETPYSNHLVLDANTVLNAIARLSLFPPEDPKKAALMPATVSIANDEMVITDASGNTECITIENGSYTDEDGYTMEISLAYLKLALESYKNEHVTVNCGNRRSVVITHGNISHLISEGVFR